MTIRTSVGTYTVADFLELRAANRLEINRDFQRLEVWRTPAKVYFIDSILRGFPIPKLYFRSRIDPATQSSVREIVDGQQRLAAIFEFADNKLRLTSRAADLAGKRWQDLDSAQQQDFLSYTFTAEQLIGASDDDVLEVFARINSYTVALAPAELRHAQWQGDFKWTVHETSRALTWLWDRNDVLTLAQRTRLADDALVADLLIQIKQGPTGGEKGNLDKAYKNWDGVFPDGERCKEILLNTLAQLDEWIPGVLVPPIARPAHLTMLVSAAAHVLFGVRHNPVPWLTTISELPAAPEAPVSQDEWDVVKERLEQLATIINLLDEPDDEQQAAFWRASRSAPINLASRRVRFPEYVRTFGA